MLVCHGQCWADSPEETNPLMGVGWGTKIVAYGGLFVMAANVKF